VSRGDVLVAGLQATTWSRGGVRTSESACPAWLAQMDGLWTTSKGDALVVLIGYHGGSDSCGEPAQSAHVVMTR
jgi:hypothetical protein